MLPEKKEKIDIDIREVYRYLGYGTADPPASIAGRVDDGVEEIYRVSELRSMYRRFGIAFSREEDSIIIGDMTIRSRDLRRALDGCVEVYLFGATIGVGVDRLIAKATVKGLTEAAIYQAAGAAYIEAYCDEISREVRRLAGQQGRGTKPRFSPGYGDLGIENQKKIFSLLELTKHTGISLTEGMLMTPSKSVTAIIGVTCNRTRGNGPEGEEGGTYVIGHDCTSCDMISCPFRVQDVIR